ncbi:hypothetical protein LCGC14_2846010 [marine sediment metagenome]|uniref:Uncharacterized protein n=1 Tax=marine sediment metagenome TaxID=412755 RepID=A0A0F9AI56_9ZZZZ
MPTTPLIYAVHCDCGNDKPVNSQACARCTFLDRSMSGSGAVVAELRIRGHATIDELVDDIGASRDTVYNCVLRLVQAGRLRKRVVDEMSGRIEVELVS